MRFGSRIARLTAAAGALNAGIGTSGSMAGVSRGRKSRASARVNGRASFASSSSKTNTPRVTIAREAFLGHMGCSMLEPRVDERRGAGASGITNCDHHPRDDRGLSIVRRLAVKPQAAIVPALRNVMRGGGKDSHQRERRRYVRKGDCAGRDLVEDIASRVQTGSAEEDPSDQHEVKREERACEASPCSRRWRPLTS